MQHPALPAGVPRAAWAVALLPRLLGCLEASELLGPAELLMDAVMAVGGLAVGGLVSWLPR